MVWKELNDRLPAKLHSMESYPSDMESGFSNEAPEGNSKNWISKVWELRVVMLIGLTCWGKMGWLPFLSISRICSQMTGHWLTPQAPPRLWLWLCTAYLGQSFGCLTDRCDHIIADLCWLLAVIHGHSRDGWTRSCLGKSFSRIDKWKGDLCLGTFSKSDNVCVLLSDVLKIWL